KTRATPVRSSAPGPRSSGKPARRARRARARRSTICSSRHMPLISPADQDRLRESFAEMKRAVRLLFFTQTLDCEACMQTRQILDELPPLSDKITVEEVNFVLDADRAK